MILCMRITISLDDRRDAHAEHEAYAEWVTRLATGPEPFALSPLALSGLVRIVTNPSVFPRPSTLDEVFGFIDQMTRRPTARKFHPGAHRWDLFQDLCRKTNASGKLVADAYHAALAIEHGCVWVTTDSDFSRFPGLR